MLGVAEQTVVDPATAGFTEDAKVLAMMAKFGIEAVRGCTGSLLSGRVRTISTAASSCSISRGSITAFMGFAVVWVPIHRWLNRPLRPPPNGGSTAEGWLRPSRAKLCKRQNYARSL